MSPDERLDEIDQEIIRLLGENARRTVADIADRVSLSPAPVRRRIDRLEQIGVIAGYTVVLDHSKVGPAIEAFTELRFSGRADIDEILETAAKSPEVREVFTIAGDPDALARIRVDDMDHLRDVIDQLRKSGRVTGTKTLMVLGRWSRPEGPGVG